MTFRKKTARGIGIALSLTLLSGACAEARPIGDPRTGGPLASALSGYELQVLVDGVPAPTFFQGGETYVLGELGARYTLRILNHTGRRIEAVASVDGRDVVDGHAADFRNKRGYLVPAWGQVDIDGWRLSRAEVAAFRFSSVADSYAARTGSAREVGVIGAAIFPERYLPRPRPRPLELPYTDPRASSPPYPERERYPDADGLADEGGARAEHRSAKGAADAAPAPSAAAPGPVGGGAATSGAGRGYAESSRRPGLGTEFGEAVGSSVREVTFVRERERPGRRAGRPLQRPRRARGAGHQRRARHVRGLGLRSRPRAAPDRQPVPGRRAPLRAAAALLERPRLPLKNSRSTSPRRALARRGFRAWQASNSRLTGHLLTVTSRPATGEDASTEERELPAQHSTDVYLPDRRPWATAACVIRDL